MADTNSGKLSWHRVLGPEGLPEGRVTTVTAGTQTIALTHYEGRYGALDNACPHQAGPLGEGSIENGYLRCPWHGWDFCPHTGKPPGGYDDGVDTFPVEVREDGIYVGVEEEPSHVRTVTDVIAETLVNWGVKHVFGMVGHSNLGMADALRRQEEQGNIQFFGIRHEGAAAFACSAYGKLTGKPAACFTIAGPGATNLLTGFYDAKVDRSPVLALTGQVDAQVLGPGAFQEVDLAGAFSDVAAFVQPVLHSSRHAELANLAVKNALLKRDVSVLILPDEVQTIQVGDDVEAGKPDGRLTPLDISPPKVSLDAAIGKIRESKRPVIIVGHGARFNMPAVIEFAEQLKAPVLTTFKGKGIISDHHPLAGGVLGRSGTPVASWFMNESDLLIVIGASFSNHTGITPKKPLIQIDFDAMQLGKFHKVDVPVWGEIGVTVNHLKTALEDYQPEGDIEAEVAERWKIWREEKTKRLADDRGEGVSSAAIFDALNRHVQEDAIIAVDVGNNAYSFGRYFESSGKQAVLMSGYLGSIGFGLPAALGAAAAEPDRPIWVVCGDGGLCQYLAELTTAVKYQFNIKIVLLNNNELGKISKEQRAGEFEVWKTDLLNPKFAEYARGCGAFGLEVTAKDQLDKALQQAVSVEGPALVEIKSDVQLV